MIKRREKKTADWLVVTRTGNPPKGFKKIEVFAFPKKKDALDFINDVTRNNVEVMLAKEKK